MSWEIAFDSKPSRITKTGSHGSALFPTSWTQQIDLMREGVRIRMIWPKIVLNRVPAQIEKQIVSKPEESPFFKPFTKFPAAIASADRDRLTKAATEAIASGVIPSFQKLKKYFVDEYLPAAFDQVGVWQMPQGAEFYACLAATAHHRPRSRRSKSTRKVWPKSRASAPRCRRSGKGRVQGNVVGIFHQIANRSAILLQDARRITGSVPRPGQAHRSEPG